MRRRGKVDGNHADVREAFRRLGWQTLDCSSLGSGAPDLFVSRGGRTVAVEVKLPKGKLRPAQVDWLSTWGGETAVVRGYDDVLALTNRWTG